MHNRQESEQNNLFNNPSEIDAITSKSLDLIQQILPASTLKDLDIYIYQDLLISALKKGRIDVVKMFHEQAPLSAHNQIDDVENFNAYPLINYLFKTCDLGFIEWFIANNPFLKKRCNLVIERAIKEGNLAALKALENHDTYRDMIGNGSTDYYKTNFENFSYDDGMCLPPVMTAIACEQFEILKWLVEEKNHSLDIPIDIFQQDIVHFTCSFTNTEGELEKDRYVENNKRTKQVDERYLIFKWLVEEKKMPLTNKIHSYSRSKNEADLFQHIMDLNHPIIVFPIFQWLFLTNAKFFHTSIVNSFKGEFATYVLKLPTEDIQSISNILFKLIKFCQKSSNDNVRNNSTLFLLQLCCGHSGLLNWFLANLDKLGAFDDSTKQALNYFSQFDTTKRYTLPEEIKLSDNAIRALLWDINRREKSPSPEVSLKLLEQIQSKTPEEIAAICFCLKKLLENAAPLNQNIPLHNLQPQIMPHQLPQPPVNLGLRNINLPNFLPARLIPHQFPQLPVNQAPMNAVINPALAAPNRHSNLKAQLLLADKMDHYIDQKHTLSDQDYFSYYQAMLLKKITIYKEQNEFNLCKIAYRRLLKLCVQAIKKTLPQARIDFFNWSTLYPSNCLESELLSILNKSTGGTVSNENLISSFFRLYDRIMEITDHQNVALLTMLYDGMELILNRFSHNYPLSFDISQQWRNFLSNTESHQFFKDKLAALEKRLEDASQLTAIISGSATPFVNLLRMNQEKDQKISKLEERIKALEAAQPLSSNTGVTLFQSKPNSDLSKKRPREDEDQEDNEHVEKWQRLSDQSLKQ